MADPVAAALSKLFPDRKVQPKEGPVTPELAKQRAALLLHWAEHPWNWLSGKDTDGTPIIRTKDEGSDDPVKPWPTDKEYLRWYIELLHNGDEYPQLLCDKCRQMMLTWATLLYIDWQCRFRTARRWPWSKSTEDEAKEQLKDKVLWVHEHLPQWVQDALPMVCKPQTRCSYLRTGSYILAVAENVAEREARGGTASGIGIDECARQHGFEDIVAAAGPMARRCIAITTAELGNAGAAFCSQIKESVEKHGIIVDYHQGDFESRHGTYWLVRQDPISGWTLLEIEAEADPGKRTIAWHTAAEKKIGSHRKYLQEIRRDWTVSSNDPFYPEFASKPDLYKVDCESLLPGPIVRGWDFGRRHPACVWLQLNERRNRVHVLREWMPHDVQAGTFGDVVLWLSGTLSKDRLDPEGYRIASKLEADPDFPPVPFFESSPAMPLSFIDYSGPEAVNERSEVSSESRERSVAQILAKKGIVLGWWGVSLETRELIVRKLLRIQRDGLPGILFDSSCRILIKGFGGAITFGKPRKGELSADRRHKDGYYDNCLSGDTPVRTVTGWRPIRDLVDTEGTTYAYDGRRLVPARYRHVRRTRENAEVLRITLDDGKQLRATPDHRIMRRDGAWARADELRPGDSLMPFCEGKVVVVSVEPAGREDVYCMVVDGLHNFPAAGVMVSNCDDALGYALANLIPVEGELPEPGPSTPGAYGGRDAFSRGDAMANDGGMSLPPRG